MVASWTSGDPDAGVADAVEELSDSAAPPRGDGGTEPWSDISYASLEASESDDVMMLLLRLRLRTARSPELSSCANNVLVGAEDAISAASASKRISSL